MNRKTVDNPGLSLSVPLTGESEIRGLASLLMRLSGSGGNDGKSITYYMLLSTVYQMDFMKVYK